MAAALRSLAWRLEGTFRWLLLASALRIVGASAALAPRAFAVSEAGVDVLGSAGPARFRFHATGPGPMVAIRTRAGLAVLTPERPAEFAGEVARLSG